MRPAASAETVPLQALALPSAPSCCFLRAAMSIRRRITSSTGEARVVPVRSRLPAGELRPQHLVKHLDDAAVLSDIENDEASGRIEVWRRHPGHHGRADRTAVLRDGLDGRADLFLAWKLKDLNVLGINAQHLPLWPKEHLRNRPGGLYRSSGKADCGDEFIVTSDRPALRWSSRLAAG